LGGIAGLGATWGTDLLEGFGGTFGTGGLTFNGGGVVEGENDFDCLKDLVA
jgi:hypothetical protein